MREPVKKSAMRRNEWLARLSDLARREPEREDPVAALQLLGRYHGWLNRHDRRVEKLKKTLMSTLTSFRRLNRHDRRVEKLKLEAARTSSLGRHGQNGS
jgi:hypothetical protein